MSAALNGETFAYAGMALKTGVRVIDTALCAILAMSTEVTTAGPRSADLMGRLQELRWDSAAQLWVPLLVGDRLLGARASGPRAAARRPVHP